jgi:integrase
MAIYLAYSVEFPGNWDPSLVDERRNPREGHTCPAHRETPRSRQSQSRHAARVPAELQDHIQPPIGSTNMAAVDAHVLDSFYAELRRWRIHCDGSNKFMWEGADWGTLVWLAMTAGCRRAELCALRWRDADLTNGTLNVRTSIDQHGAKTTEKDTKKHQHRWIALATETVIALQEHKAMPLGNSLGLYEKATSSASADIALTRKPRSTFGTKTAKRWLLS